MHQPDHAAPDLVVSKLAPDLVGERLRSYLLVLVPREAARFNLGGWQVVGEALREQVNFGDQQVVEKALGEQDNLGG